MRAPPLARMAAVAAPRPDAEPVTIAHKPSFDIRISPYGFETVMADTISCKQMPANPRCFVMRNYFCPPPCCMSPLQAALRRQPLVMAMAFPHHPVQEKA